MDHSGFDELLLPGRLLRRLHLRWMGDPYLAAVVQGCPLAVHLLPAAIDGHRKPAHIRPVIQMPDKPPADVAKHWMPAEESVPFLHRPRPSLHHGLFESLALSRQGVSQ